MDDLRRDRKRIKRAIAVAKEKNVIDGKTYYILRDPRGMPGAYHSNDIKYLRQVGIIPKEIKYDKMLEVALAVVTSNEVKFNEYVQVQNKRESLKHASKSSI